MAPLVVSIHQHFHQPYRGVWGARKPHSPRMPSLPESWAMSASGAPFNFTKRIARESYLPLLGGGAAISAYRHGSFDISPLLWHAMAEFYGAAFLQPLKDAVYSSRAAQWGRPNVLAHGYHHTIIPLSRHALDKRLQIGWGVAEAQAAFGRVEGFWFPEAAGDLESFEILSSHHDIHFTILSPTAIQGFKINGRYQPMQWRERGGGHVPWFDQSTPYRVTLSNGDPFYVFFYDYELSKWLAFGDLLEDSSGNRLANAIDSRRFEHNIVIAATDGETYGSYGRPHGAEALLNYFNREAASREHLLASPAAILAHFLDRGFPIPEVILNPQFSWSCDHGLGRWGGRNGNGDHDCGCEGHHPWRPQLREAFHWLSSEVETLYHRFTKGTLADPEQAQLDYINVLLGKVTFPEFIVAHSHVPLEESQIALFSTLFDLLYDVQGMYLSCGWFFRGIGYETGFNFTAAWNVLRKAKMLDLEWSEAREETFLDQLEQIKNTSGDSRQARNAREGYEWAVHGQDGKGGQTAMLQQHQDYLVFANGSATSPRWETYFSS